MIIRLRRYESSVRPGGPQVDEEQRSMEGRNGSNIEPPSVTVSWQCSLTELPVPLEDSKGSFVYHLVKI
jgi:hypothetical protein